MKFRAALAGAVLAASPASATWIPAESTPSLKCDIGPVERQLGGTAWLQFACDDDKSLVFVTAKGNQASPFYFVVYAKDEGYAIYGEGTGDRAFTTSAFEALEKYTTADFKRMVAEAREVSLDP